MDNSHEYDGKDEITCPFCGDIDFDSAGLKAHIVYGDCAEFESIPLIKRLF